MPKRLCYLVVKATPTIGSGRHLILVRRRRSSLDWPPTYQDVWAEATCPGGAAVAVRPGDIVRTSGRGGLTWTPVHSAHRDVPLPVLRPLRVIMPSPELVAELTAALALPWDPDTICHVPYGRPRATA